MEKRIKSILNTIYVFKEVQIASKTFLVMLIPVLTFLILLELFVPKSSTIGNLDYNSIMVIPNLKIYILYLTASASHIILSVIIIIFLSRKLFKNMTHLKSKILLKRLLIFIFIITFLFLILDYVHTNLALLSHERVYLYLSKSEYFLKYFRLILNIHHFNGFYIFSLIPFTLIFLGLIIIVLTCFNIGKDLAEVLENLEPNAEESKRKIFQNKIEEFHNYLYLLSFILVTSTIATILFFHIPLSIIREGEIYNSFQSVSLSMGICWGVIFSLTMLTMCFYPFFVIQNKLRNLIENSEVAGNKEMKMWLEKLQNNYIVYKNIKSMISVIAPTFISLVAQFI